MLWHFPSLRWNALCPESSTSLQTASSRAESRRRREYAYFPRQNCRCAMRRELQTLRCANVQCAKKLQQTTLASSEARGARREVRGADLVRCLGRGATGQHLFHELRVGLPVILVCAIPQRLLRVGNAPITRGRHLHSRAAASAKPPVAQPLPSRRLRKPTESIDFNRSGAPRSTTISGQARVPSKCTNSGTWSEQIAGSAECSHSAHSRLRAAQLYRHKRRARAAMRIALAAPQACDCTEQ